MTTTKPSITIIVALLYPKFGIGFKGSLPWKLKNEMKYFRQVTTKTVSPSRQNVVIMGRKTWNSIPTKFRPLPNRVNVILTHDVEKLALEMHNELQACPEGIIIAKSVQNSIDKALDLIGLPNIENFFVIGGAQIYNHCLEADLCDRILLTQITTDRDVEMDTFLNLPVYEENSRWEEKDLENYLKEKGVEGFEVDNVEGDFKYKFQLFERRNED